MGMAANNYVRKPGTEPLTLSVKAADSGPESELDVPLRAGDVAWCAFPFHSAPGSPGIYPRPCLVLETRSIDGAAFHLVAYGTSKKLAPCERWPGDVVFGPQDGEHFEALGVDGPGKFRLCQLALLPAVPAFFPTPPFRYSAYCGRPVEGCRIGRLTLEMVRVVRYAADELDRFRKRKGLPAASASAVGPHQAFATPAKSPQRARAR
jgi:hypothetical protein